MIASVRNSLFALSPSSWAGPILGKELRVSSRRRRNYMVRSIYIIVLMVFVAFVWARSIFMAGDPGMNRAAWLTATYASAAKAVTVTICIFQFCIVQILAVVMLSTSVNEEITKRTLGVLMTTPITSRQIVLGKLAGKLLQLVLLVSLSLPVLAIIRIFGGVPWDYLVSSTCITLAAGVFFGCVSLFFSIGSRSAYLAIMRAVFVLGTLFFVIPVVSGMFFRNPLASNKASLHLLYDVLAVLNPYVAMSRATAAVTSSKVVPFAWQIHCALMLLASAAAIWLCTARLRRVALKEACGDATGDRWLFWRRKKSAYRAEIVGDPSRIRHVKGSPVLWKELASPLIQNATGRKNLIAAGAAILCLVITYWANWSQRGLRGQFVQTFYVVMFVIAWGVVQAVVSATTITAEKESRAWPILLITPLSSWRIIRDKVIASILRTSPVWSFMVLHVIFFTAKGYIHPVGLLHIPLIALPIVILLASSGVYFSSVFRKSTTAVTANLAFAAIIWVIVPVAWTIYCGANRADAFSAQVLASVNPLIMSFVVLSGETGWRAKSTLDNLDYSWPFNSFSEFRTTTWFIAAVGGAYLLTAFIFLWRAKQGLRRNILSE